MRYFWGILILVFFTTCKTNQKSKGDTFPESVTLKITVKNKAGAIVPQAVVNIFDLEDDYNTALGNGNTSIGYQTGLTNTTGFISLNAVKPNIENYILVTLYDTVNAIFYSNKNISSKIDVIPAGSVIEMTITIEPLTANVAFYTTDPLVSTYFIVVEIAGAKDTIKVPFTGSVVTAQTPEAAVLQIAPGTYSYQAYNKFGCSWTNQVTVNPGDFIPIQLSNCQVSRVTFYFTDTSPSATVNFGTYDVYVDNVKIGTLSDIFSNGGSATCGLDDDAFGVTAYLDPLTTHTYQIKNPGSQCTWISTFNAPTAGTCLQIPIQKTIINSNICP